jgi:hypothetical protein
MKSIPTLLLVFAFSVLFAQEESKKKFKYISFEVIYSSEGYQKVRGGAELKQNVVSMAKETGDESVIKAIESADDSIKLLNTLGESGYELVTIVQSGKPEETRAIFYLKKEFEK